jgi:Photosynthetic reaction centre cytochrome C subunit
MTRLVAGLLMVLANSTMNLHAQPPAKPSMVDSPTVKVLTGLTVPEFEQEMQHFVEATGISCGGCHMPRGNFASDENPQKLKAREMIEMTKALNKQFFASHKPAEGESVLGRVTCYTCHKGEAKPKTAP